MSPEQEKLLFEYVVEGKNARASNSDKLDSVAVTQQKLYNEMQLHFVNDEANQREIKQALAGLGSRVESLEDENENTGKYRIEELRTKLKEREEQGTWWKRWGIQTIGVVLLSTFAAVVSALVTLMRKSP